MDYTEKLQEYLDKEMEAIRNLDLREVDQVLKLLEDARLSDRNIYICGNGGSAATASHYCCDFNKGVNENQGKKYNFENLSDNVPTLLAIANDLSYDEIFRFPLKNKMRPGDVFIGISGSGNSENVVRAMEYAKSIGGITIAIVGYSGGKLKKMADHCIHVNIDNMQITEDIHMVIGHMMRHVLSNLCKQ